MIQKLYYLLGLAGSICLHQQAGYAMQPKVQEPFAKVDTTGQFKKVRVTVKDLGSSKLLDSVRVTLGKEYKYTDQGVAVFENNEDAILIFSKPGYNKVVRKISSSSMLVRMMKTDEPADGYFVNTALSKNANELFSGSATIVTGEQLRKVSSLSLLDGLKFYEPALIVMRSNRDGGNPNALPQISLRGASHFPFSATVIKNNNVTSGVQTSPSAADYIASNILNNNSPVILLDGVQVSTQTILDIDLNRIKSVVVLKDAAATASYGMRGGNGVIAVQTYKPDGKMEISFSEQVQIVAPNISSFQPLTAKQKLVIEQNSGLFTGPWAPVYQNRYDQAYNNNMNTNWLSIPLQNRVSAKHSLALNAGNDDVVYGLTASYNDVEGTMKGSYRKTIDLSAYFGGRIGAITFNNQFSYLGANAANSPYGSFSSYAKMNPYWDPNDPFTGKFQKVLETDVFANQTLTFLNPAYNADLNTLDASKYARFSNLTNINWIMGSGFQLNGMVSITKQSDELNRFLPPNHTAFANVPVDSLFKRGSYNYTSNSFMDVQGGLRLQYENHFDKHRIFANIGQNITQTSSESEGVAVSGFATDRLADISFGNAYSILKPVSGKIVTRYASAFGNFGYSYDGRYQIDLSGSADRYSGLNRGANFGAVGLSWNVNQEQFLKSVKWIELLKLKGSLGIAGNQGFLSYLNRTTYGYYTNQQYVPAGGGIGTIGIGLGAYMTGYANTNLLAPETFKQDVGLDAVFFNHRLTLNIDVYKQLNRRMIMPVSSLPSTGYQSFSYYSNNGEIQNNGFEVAATAMLYSSPGNNFGVNLMASALHATDKINAMASYLSEVNNYNNFKADQQTIQPQYVVGRSIYAIWAVPSLGIDPQTGKELFLKKDQSTTTVWDANDKVFAGNLTPKWLGSFGTDITFRQFSFGAYFNYQLGAKVYNQTMANLENANVNDNMDGRALDVNRWTPGMANAAYKALFNSPTYATTRLVENDNKIQCSSLMLGYKLPKMIAEKVKAKNLGVKFMVNNAFELGGADMQRGIDYPFQRNYTFILNANF